MTLEPPVLGPIQEEDKLLLQAVVKMIQPSTVIEFGFLYGDSTKALLEALPADSYLISIDVNLPPDTDQVLGLLQDCRLRFIHQDQTKPLYLLKDSVDFVFFDASHDFKANLGTYDWLKEFLSPNSILAVHDTGFWPYNPFESFIWGKQTEEGYAHRPDEQTFVRYLVSEGWHRINFGTTKIFRHGMTLLQR